ncbi:AAA family ATPase, partial [bacterium]
GKVRAVLRGLSRARLRPMPGGHEATATSLTEPAETSPRAEAARRTLVEAFAALAAADERIPVEALEAVEATRSAGKAADAVAHHLPGAPADRQALLETLDPIERALAALGVVGHETELLEIEADLRRQTERRIGDEQRTLLLREKLRTIQAELGGANVPTETDLLRRRVETTDLPESVRRGVSADIDRLGAGPAESAEAATLRHSIETVLGFPWAAAAQMETDVTRVRARFDAHHAGLEGLKARVAELAAMAKLGGSGAFAPLLLVGPPGVGKTSAARGLAEALGLPFATVALGGVRDESEIRGHRRAYVGASIGRLAGAVMRAGVGNPVILLDEIDKIDPSGAPAAALLEALDAEQAGAFLDNYLGHAIDLRRCLFVATANALEPIPGALRDRFEIVEMQGYSVRERAQIARAHLWPRALAQAGLDSVADADRLTVPALERLVDGYSREPGVRDLGRKLSAIARALALELCEGGLGIIHPAHLERLFGPTEPPRPVARPRPGATYALMVSGRGGEVVPIEAAILSGEGSGQLTVTGLVGPSMLESARTALAWLRANAEWPRGREAHVHAGEAGVPKDGPSAGLPLALALASAAGNHALREEIAATGEIDLLGAVHPVGGVREK